MDIEIQSAALTMELVARPHIERLQRLFHGDVLPFPRGCFYNINPWHLQFVTSWLATRQPRRVLDCGAMYSFRPFTEFSFCEEYHAVDNLQLHHNKDFNNLPKFKEWEKLVRRKSGGRIQFKFGHLENLPYPDSFFDVVTCVHTLEYAFDDVSGMQEIRRVLRPGGTILLITRMNWFHNISYIPLLRSRFYGVTELAALVGESVKRIVSDGGPERCTVGNPWPPHVNVFLEI